MKVYHKLIILTAMVISLVGCSSENNPMVEQNSKQLEIVTDKESEQKEEDVVNTVTVDTPNTVESNVENECSETASDYDSLDPTVHMQNNGDGTYSFSEEFIGTITSYDYLAGATDEELHDFLNGVAPIFEGLNGKAVDDVMSMFTGNLHKENQTIVESQTGQTQNQGSQSQSSQNNSQSNQNNQNNQSNQNNGNSNTGNSNSGDNNNSTGNSNPTPPENESSEGDGTFSFSDEQFGGGGQGDIPDGFTGIH